MDTELAENEFGGGTEKHRISYLEVMKPEPGQNNRNSRQAKKEE